MSFLQWLGISPKSRAYMILRWQSYDSGYHLYVERAARRHGLHGWMRVRRQPLNNYLEIEVEGRQRRIVDFMNDLPKGPANSGAARAEVQWKTPKGLFHNFQVRI